MWKLDTSVYVRAADSNGPDQAMCQALIDALDNQAAPIAADIAADYALRGADAVYVAVACRHGCTLVSLDREQRERPAAIITTRTPADALAELQPPPGAL